MKSPKFLKSKRNRLLFFGSILFICVISTIYCIYNETLLEQFLETLTPSYSKFITVSVSVIVGVLCIGISNEIFSGDLHEWLKGEPSEPHDIQSVIDTKTIEKQTLQPNLVCIKTSSNTFVVKDKRQVITEVPSSDSQAIIAVFQNKPNPPNKTGSIENIHADITYFAVDSPYRLEKYPDSIIPSWLGELTPTVSFGVTMKHELVLGYIKKSEDGRFQYFSTFEKPFEPYVIGEQPLIPTPQDFETRDRRIIIVVNLIGGEHAEFGKQFEFELTIQETNCRIEYLSDEVKLQKNKSIISNLERFALQGRELLRNPKEVDSNFNFGSDHHKWLTEFESKKQNWLVETVSYISRNVGGRETSQVCFEPQLSEVGFIWGEPKDFNFDDAERFYFSIASGFVGRLSHQVIALEKIIEELKAELSSFENSSS